MTTNPPSVVAGFIIEPDDPPSAPPPRAANPKPDDASVLLRGIRISLNSDIGAAFVVDCCRNRERIFSDERLREKYEINSDTDWNNILNNKTLRLAINAERDRRVLNGTAAQEPACNEFTRAPKILGEILSDPKASPRHRIEASKELRATARSGDEKSDVDSDRVVITINLGGDEKLVVDSGPLPPNRITRENLDAETEG